MRHSPIGLTTYNDMYAEVPHESGTFFRRQVCEMVGFLNLKNLKGWFKLTLIKCSYYITGSVKFFNSLVNIPRTRDV